MKLFLDDVDDYEMMKPVMNPLKFIFLLIFIATKILVIIPFLKTVTPLRFLFKVILVE